MGRPKFEKRYVLGEGFPYLDSEVTIGLSDENDDLVLLDGSSWRIDNTRPRYRLVLERVEDDDDE